MKCTKGRVSEIVRPRTEKEDPWSCEEKRVRADVEDDDAELVTPPCRDQDSKPRSSLRDPAVRRLYGRLFRMNIATPSSLGSTRRHRTTSRARERFSSRDIDLLLKQIRVATGEANLTWDAVQQRVARMRQKETVARIQFRFQQAWKESMFPALKKLIAKGLIEKPTEANPLFLQDDDAKPHRKVINGKRVTELICEVGLRDFGIDIVPLDPAQPPQSPDTNPLDTFVFRMMNVRFRRLRAQSRVKQLVTGLRNRPDAAVVELEAEPESVHDEEFDDDEPQDEFVHRCEGVPLRCAVDGCAPCHGVLKRMTQRPFAICETGGARRMRTGSDCRRSRLYKSAIDPPTVSEDEPWVCPQCMYHLFRNDDRSRDLCVMCGKPSARSGDCMGTDMVSCDGRWEGLVHKSCAGYDEAEELQEEHDAWFCLACDSLPVADGDGGDDDEMEEIEQRPPHENYVNGFIRAIDAALAELPRDAFEHGFESRVFFKKIVGAEGRNDYNLHFRAERKRKAKQGQVVGRAQRGEKRKNSLPNFANA
jgi:hypothetical protein